MKIFKTSLIFLVLAAPVRTFAQTDSVAEEQREAVRQTMVALNQSSNQIGQEIFSEPQRASDAGCLDGIKGIDLSVFQVDITSVWSALASTVKDNILNSTCSAASDWANDQTAALETSMDAPFGLGTISLSQGNAITDWQSVSREDVELSPAELEAKVTTGTLGQVPNRVIPSPRTREIESRADTPTADREAIESEFPQIFNFKQLWKDPE